MYLYIRDMYPVGDFLIQPGNDMVLLVFLLWFIIDMSLVKKVYHYRPWTFSIKPTSPFLILQFWVFFREFIYLYVKGLVPKQ
jgi:hypothetical protein